MYKNNLVSGALLVLMWALVIGPAGATDAPGGERGSYQADGVSFSISVRTPEQIRAFYSARGFPEAAIRELESKCLLTIGIHNGRKDVVWLEPAKWRFSAADGSEVSRIGRVEWNARWKQLQIPLASRATFGWTQLPDSRDLQPGEGVGGNVAVIPTPQEFSVEAVFDTGENRDGPVIRIRADGLKCQAVAGESQ
jgi:hypothetical protein